MGEENYLLGTDDVELQRLSQQHETWKEEVDQLMKSADIKTGSHILELGAGPGFLSMELAERVGSHGHVLGVDVSSRFAAYFQERASAAGFSQMAYRVGDVLDIELPEEAFDCVVARWLFSFLRYPEKVLERSHESLKRGGRMVLYDYCNYRAVGFRPQNDALDKGFAAVYQSFQSSGGNLDVGDYLPGMLRQAGFVIERLVPIIRVARPGESAWKWFDAFRQSFFPKLLDAGFLTKLEMHELERALEAYGKDPGCFFFTPPMIGIIACKQ